MTLKREMTYLECYEWLYDHLDTYEKRNILERLNKCVENQKDIYKYAIAEKQMLLDRKESWSTKLEVYDKETKTTHIVGNDTHDCLLVRNGKVEYYNLQNGCGTPDTYEFVEKSLYDDEVQE